MDGRRPVAGRYEAASATTPRLAAGVLREAEFGRSARGACRRRHRLRTESRSPSDRRLGEQRGAHWLREIQVQLLATAFGEDTFPSRSPAAEARLRRSGDSVGSLEFSVLGSQFSVIAAGKRRLSPEAKVHPLLFDSQG